MPFPAVAFACVRIGELIVAVVGEGQIARSASIEFVHQAQIFAERIAVFDTHEGNFFSRRADSTCINGGECQLDFFRCDRLRELMNRVELFYGAVVRPFIAGGFERFGILRLAGLSDKDAKKQAIETAVTHLRQIELSVETLCVVGLRNQVSRSKVDVTVESEHSLVNRTRVFYSSIFCAGTLRGERRGGSYHFEQCIDNLNEYSAWPIEMTSATLTDLRWVIHVRANAIHR